tara:strand:- start:3371 stop:3634 length:264 start_codon:yes stop_codon:yes gene_type:complete
MSLTNRKTALVRRHLAKARAANHHRQNYGGSTGGRKSLDSGSGISVLNRRSAQQAADSQIFKEDLDTYGARQEVWNAKKDIYPSLGT